MKSVRCDNANCEEKIEMPDDYEPEYCCSGHMCGCYGYPINPVFCDPCEKEIFGEPVEVGGVL